MSSNSEAQKNDKKLLGQSPLLLEFERESGVGIRRGVLGARCTTFSIGGAMEAILEPQTIAELGVTLKFLTQNKLPYRILGAGSNLLVPDSGVDFCVVRLGRGLRYFKEVSSGTFLVGGATSLMSLSRELSEAGWSGLEFAGGIPASFGGAVKMNSGAHGCEIAAVLKEVTCVSAHGEVYSFLRRDRPYHYRDGGIEQGAVVAEATITLVPGDRDTVRARRAQFLAQRKSTQPLAMPSAGSVFKNPFGYPAAGELLDRAGLKGSHEGGAEVSRLHANWIVNPERKASAADVSRLIEACQKTVFEAFSVKLQREIVVW